MMAPHEVHKVAAGVSYKPGWRLSCVAGPRRTSLWWFFPAPDWAVDEVVKDWHSREWTIHTDELSEDSLIKTAFAAALQAEEHECREAFSYRGVRLFDPHLAVQKLMEAVCPKNLPAP